MKESNFYSDDFEQLIRGKTEQYKMYPSENVWKGVHSALHTKRKWFIGSMAVLVTGILFLAGRELIAPSNHPIALHKPAAGLASTADASRSSAPADIIPAPLAALRPVNPATAATRHNTAEQGPASADISITVSHPVLSQSDLSEWLSQVVRLPEQAPELAVIESKPAITDQGKEEEGSVAKAWENAAGQHKETAETAETDNALLAKPVEGATTDATAARDVLESLSAYGPTSRLDGTGANRSSVTGRHHLPETADESAKADANAIAEADDQSRINWLHDYAMNILTPTAKQQRTYLQLTLAPTLTTSKLGGIDQAEQKFGIPYTGNDLRHSAALGFEFGGSILYRLTRNLSIKGGLQFNFSRYQLGTYPTYDPAQPAGVTYFTSWGYQLDTVMNSRNQGSGARQTGTAMQRLDNDYYQLSAPIGFELRVLGNERLQFNIGATIQPSYLFNTNSFVMNSDFTEYNKQPALYRRWNLNGGVEAFLSYRTGAIRWQIGPEFRYQLLSSYKSSYNGMPYSITENLKGYGLKFGITKALP